MGRARDRLRVALADPTPRRTGGSPHPETTENSPARTPARTRPDAAGGAHVGRLASAPARAGLGGQQRTKETRVEWHEWKTGVYYRQEQAGRTAGGRGVLAEKLVIGWQGDPLEFGRRLHWEALRGGLGRARAGQVVGDGAPWIWNVAHDRWSGATEVLDFYHASQHLWELGRALHGEDEAATAKWVEPRRHQLRHGREKQVLAEIAGLRVPRGAAGKVVQREQNYFAAQAGRMNYQSLHRRGWAIGSGPVESACRQRQCRFKRPGQFWTPKGMRHLGALTEARHNHHWDELWRAG